MGCFSAPSSKAAPVATLTPAQSDLVAQLAGQAKPAIAAVGGATIPGQEFAPAGPSPLQQQAFGLAQQLPQQLAFDPQRVAQQFQPVADFARQGFQQETIPAIAGAVGFGGGARSSGFQDILARQGRNLELGLAAQLGQQQFGAFNQAQQFQQQLPGQLAGLGQLQQSFPEAQRQFDLQNFLVGAPESDPRLGFIGPAFTSAFDTAITQRGAGLGAALLTGAVGGFAQGFGQSQSDERVKDNIESIEGSLEKLKQIEGKTYNYISDVTDTPEQKRAGVIAQDVEKVLPEAVEEKNGIKHVDYNAVLALTVNAVNELARKVA